MHKNATKLVSEISFNEKKQSHLWLIHGRQFLRSLSHICFCGDVNSGGVACDQAFNKFWSGDVNRATLHCWLEAVKHLWRPLRWPVVVATSTGRRYSVDPKLCVIYSCGGLYWWRRQQGDVTVKDQKLCVILEDSWEVATTSWRQLDQLVADIGGTGVVLRGGDIYEWGRWHTGGDIYEWGMWHTALEKYQLRTH